MRARWLILVTLALLLFPALGPARAQKPDDTVYVVSYFDVSAPAAKRASDLLSQIAQAGRQAPGAMSFEALQRLASPNQFVTVEVWKTLQARAMHLEEPQIGPLRAELDSILVAPVDQRLCTIVAAPEHSNGSVDAIYAVAHIDILGPNPAGRDAFLPVLKAFSDSSRRAPGNLGYDVAEQASRTNHFEVVEIWTDEKSAAGHEISRLNKDFRAKLGVASSSPYDRRWYKPLR
jgi:quinol monooxygenase YgiN